jgi:hypothetical protein
MTSCVYGYPTDASGVDLRHGPAEGKTQSYWNYTLDVCRHEASIE